MMHGEHVDLIATDEPVHDSLWVLNDLTNEGVAEFRNSAARLRKLSQAICGGNKTGDDDWRVMRRTLTDERVNGGQVRAG